MRRFLALIAVAGLALLLAACGGGGSSSSSSTATETQAESNTGSETEKTEEGGETEEAEEGEEAASGDSVQEAAMAAVKEYLKPPEKLWITEPLPKTPETGKTVDVLDCGAPACTAWAEAALEAVKTLGWNGNHISQGTTPQSITAAWNQVTRTPPDAVLTIGIPKVLFSKQLATLASKEIPVLNASVGEEAGEGQELVIGGPKDALKVGKAMADWILSQEGEEANTMYVKSPEFPVTTSYEEGLEAEYEKLCSSCSLSNVEVSAAEIGSGANTTKIVAALHSDSGVNYVTGTDDLTLGLPSALKTGGLNEVSMIGEAPGAAQFGYLTEEGPYKASVVFAPYEVGWQMVDWLTRHFEGVSTKPSEEEAPTFILTPETLKSGASNYYPYLPSFEEEFKALWKVK
jgi:ABC-type sugar transport system substrate-binding protein